ncbi:MAG TPA: SGNH/GDSL hydrolase family protein [Thermoanaerobaculia bacterium]|nr:SGNH/GDSL hydrolase family protein [Thermoanaerobaculia bacterium]
MAEREPVLRAILLGASNLRAGLPIVVDGVRRRAGGPVEVLAACGHGRSYGGWSLFLFVRRLPGIVGCGLWQDLAERPALPTFALLTDIGNDLVYGVRVEEIAAWVKTCLDRLSRHQAEIVLTLLPVARLQRLSAWQVRLVTSVLFPGRPAPWPDLLDRALELNERLQRMGQEYGVRLVEPAADWYGIDPIHLRRGIRGEAWDRVLSHSSLGASTGPAAARIPLLSFGAKEIHLFGFHLHTPQPAASLAEGTTVSLY